MIDDVSRTLRDLLKVPDDPLKSCKISFEPPGQSFSPSDDTVNLFLYDVRENTLLRSNEPIIVREGNQAKRIPPPLRLDCSYLVTAWVQNGTDARFKEQLILTQVVAALAKFPIIPNDKLQGVLLDKQDPLPPMTVARGEEAHIDSEFWTALGGKLRASLRVSVTLSVPVFEAQSVFLVTTKKAQFAPGMDEASSALGDPLVQIGGRVLSDQGKPLAGAVVQVVDAGLEAQTDAEGRYRFTTVPVGNRQFRALATGFQVFAATRPVPGSPSDYEFQLTP